MPRFAPLLLGMLILLTCACAGLEAEPPVAATPLSTPSAVAAQSWLQDLSFSGDVKGKLNQISPGQGNLRSVCTGGRGTGADSWILTLFGPIGRRVYGFQVGIQPYRGPAAYNGAKAQVQLFRPDNSLAWSSGGDDEVSFSLDPSQESGQINASLTNLSNNQTMVKVSGRWSCRT